MATKKLSCGGRGPCCHIGYLHRHCEHCDAVISTMLYWPYTNPLYPRPYQPYWGTYSAGLQRQMQQNAGDILQAFSSNSSSTSEALPEHVCEQVS